MSHPPRPHHHLKIDCVCVKCAKIEVSSIISSHKFHKTIAGITWNYNGLGESKMKMRQCLIVILTLLMLNALTLALNTRQVKPESSTIIVPDDYATIQAAITAARSVWGNPSSGYTIFVRAGIYFENIVINMSNHYLTITGENADTTIIDGANAGQAVVTIKNVSLNSFANFTVKNSDTNAPGIYAYNSTGRITNNIVKDNFQGINIQDSFEIEIVNNNFVSNTVGINVSYAIPIPRGNNFIHHNHFIDNIQQAHVTGYPFFSDSWDDGYPSGGNYWSDYPGVDVFSGPNQDHISCYSHCKHRS